MMETQVEERIKVLSFFGDGRIKPLWFWWKKKRYRVSEVAFVYTRKEGREKIWCFSVRCEEGCFEISFNRENFSWRLEKVLES